MRGRCSPGTARTPCAGSSSRVGRRGRRGGSRTTVSARGPDDAADAVERPVLLRHVRRPRRLVTGCRAGQRIGPRRTTCSTVGSEPNWTTPSSRSPRPSTTSARSPRRRAWRFVDDLSNWYLRRSRRRFWKQAEPDAHATLHHAGDGRTTVGAVLPVPGRRGAPGRRGRSVGPPRELAEPSGEIDHELTERMAAARRLVTLGRSARTDAKMKVRQPLRRALLLHPGVALDDAVRAEIRDGSTSARSRTSTRCRD